MASSKKLSQEKLKNRHEIIRKYREENDNKPVTTVEVAEWAIQKGLWKPQAVEIKMQLAEQLSQAMREEYITDPQGRRVRAKHAAHIQVEGEQMVFWADIRDKRPETRHHMEIAFQNRRQLIVNDSRQLKKDVDSYNDNWNDEEPIQLCLDFTDDVEEYELAENETKSKKTKR
jgi:hypothetical protein